jgi:hypothetical protein
MKYIIIGYFSSKINEIIYIVFRLIVFQFGGKHYRIEFTYLAYNVGEGIVIHRSVQVKVLGFVVIGFESIAKFNVVIVEFHFLKGVQVNIVVFIVFEANFFEQFEQYFIGNPFLKNLFHY